MIGVISIALSPLVRLQTDLPSLASPLKVYLAALETGDGAA
jgi:hypothetical protein